MKKILSLDTSNSEKIKVELITDEKSFAEESSSKILRSELLLPLIDKLLKKCHTKLEELTEIKVKLNPGSFTGLRVGASVANTLGFLLKIPVNGQKQPVFPKYV